MKIKKSIINILLAFIVLGMAFVPIILAKTQEQGLLNKLYMIEMEANIKRDTSLLPVEDKIELISKYMQNDENIVLIEKTKNVFADKDMSSLAIEEVKNMQRLGLFPNVDLEKDLKLNDFSLKTFIDKDKPQNVATIWYGLFTSDEYEFYLLMDFKTYKIYQFVVHSDSEISKIEESLFSNRIAEYLDIKWDNKKEIYYSNNIYTLRDGEIVYIYSTRKNHVDFSILSKKYMKI